MSALIVGNWKMNGTSASARALAEEIAGKVKGAGKPLPEVALCPPAPLVPIVGWIIREGAVALGAQDCHPKEKGAHTATFRTKANADHGLLFERLGGVLHDLVYTIVL